MATAETVEIKHVVLVLDPDEADALAVVLSRVGGSPFKSAREHVRAVSDALRGAGHTWQQTRFKVAGAISFEDYPEGGADV